MYIYYHLSHYISHREAGLEYIRCLTALGHSVITEPDSPEKAQLAILHDDPLNFPHIFSKHPCLVSMRTIAYAVWEGDILPAEYIQTLQNVQEIWTCSHFSQASMLPHFSNVAVIPHVVRRIPLSPAALAHMQERIAEKLSRISIRKPVRNTQKNTLFLAVIDGINPRKNIKTLLTAFAKVQSQTIFPVYLILKQYRVSLDVSALPGVVSIDEELSREEMAALHAVTDAYISAHHCEGWGLGISASMAYGKPVIATGYSGNMEYMTADNSIPLPYSLGPVSSEMCQRLPLFTPAMQWGNVDSTALEQAMHMIIDRRYPPALPLNAAQICKKFGTKAVEEILQRHIQPG